MSTVDKALSVLELFSETRPAVGLSEAARLLKRDKATVQRYLASLHAQGFLEQDPLSRAYHLGPAVTRLSMVREITYPVETGVRNVLTRLVRDTGETAHASHAQPGGMSAVAIVETSFKGTRVYIDPAEVLPLHATGSGVAYLSALPEDEARRVLGRSLARFTADTRTEPEEVMALTREARARGYALMPGSYETDVVGMAAPVFAFSGEACGAVAVATPAARFDEGAEARFAGPLKRAAAAISRLYGAKGAAQEMGEED